MNTAPLELGRFRFRVPDTKFNGKGELWANMTKRKERNGGTTQGMSRTRKRKVGSAQDKKKNHLPLLKLPIQLLLKVDYIKASGGSSRDVLHP